MEALPDFTHFDREGDEQLGYEHGAAGKPRESTRPYYRRGYDRGLSVRLAGGLLVQAGFSQVAAEYLASRWARHVDYALELKEGHHIDRTIVAAIAGDGGLRACGFEPRGRRSA